MARNHWKYQNVKFKNKIILFTAVFLYLFIVVFGAIIFFQATKLFKQQSQQAIVDQMYYVINNFQIEINQYERLIQTLLVDNTFQNNLEGSISGVESINRNKYIIDYLESLRTGYIIPPEIEIYLVSQNTSQSSAPSLAVKSIIDITHESWYIKHLQDKRNYIYWHLEKDTDNGTKLCCTTGIMNKNTRNIPAYVKMSINIAAFEPMFIPLKDMAKGHLFLFSEDKEFVWSNHTGSHNFALLTADLPHTGEISNIELNDQSIHALYYFDKKTNLSLVYIQQNTKTQEAYFAFGQFFLVVIIIIIVFSLLLMMMTARLVTHRLSYLTKKIQAINHDNLNYINDIKGNDELGELSLAFEDLISRVKILIRQNADNEKERFELEFKALQSQINPHFLYNTLSAINSLASEIQADHISLAVNALAHFYRLSLSVSATAECPKAAVLACPQADGYTVRSLKKGSAPVECTNGGTKVPEARK